MKKYFILLIVAMLVSVSASAQYRKIYTDFSGLSFDYSTKKDVENYCKKNNKEFHYLDGEIVTEKFKFEDNTWDYALFSFCDNRLCQVIFIDEHDITDPYDEVIAVSSWRVISAWYKDRYAKFLTFDLGDFYNWEDTDTFMSLNCSVKDDVLTVVLTYKKK